MHQSAIERLKVFVGTTYTQFADRIQWQAATNVRSRVATPQNRPKSNREQLFPNRIQLFALGFDDFDVMQTLFTSTAGFHHMRNTCPWRAEMPSLSFVGGPC
ncbi:hypothetical protein BCR44DRAFT_1440058 [Catenaria anguillulae PL171]|uniref:Uncharacterized protein n=1 Tax=Catenaria anguillulae PL171 TaxID=765915 RepID=A0A1Y2HD72_9FUNG|nr:hypothetical protein BCR44DRAFT_1440058 [Catenaria anguillulae PL171]